MNKLSLYTAALFTTAMLSIQVANAKDIEEALKGDNTPNKELKLTADQIPQARQALDDPEEENNGENTPYNSADVEGILGLLYITLAGKKAPKGEGPESGAGPKGPETLNNEPLWERFRALYFEVISALKTFLEGEQTMDDRRVFIKTVGAVGKKCLVLKQETANDPENQDERTLKWQKNTEEAIYDVLKKYKEWLTLGVDDREKAAAKIDNILATGDLSDIAADLGGEELLAIEVDKLNLTKGTKEESYDNGGNKIIAEKFFILGKEGVYQVESQKVYKDAVAKENDELMLADLEEKKEDVGKQADKVKKEWGDSQRYKVMSKDDYKQYLKQLVEYKEITKAEMKSKLAAFDYDNEVEKSRKNVEQLYEKRKGLSGQKMQYMVQIREVENNMSKYDPSPEARQKKIEFWNTILSDEEDKVFADQLKEVINKSEIVPTEIILRSVDVDGNPTGEALVIQYIDMSNY